MSLKEIHDKQPDAFKFSDENLKIAEEILKFQLEKMVIVMIVIYVE